jgi:hypothetical protein
VPNDQFVVSISEQVHKACFTTSSDAHDCDDNISRSAEHIDSASRHLLGRADKLTLV